MFKESLQTIVEKTDGSLGAVIMGADGLAVEKFFTDEGNESNLDIAAAEFTSQVRSAGRSGKDLDLGGLRDHSLVPALAEEILIDVAESRFVFDDEYAHDGGQ